MKLVHFLLQLTLGVALLLMLATSSTSTVYAGGDLGAFCSRNIECNSNYCKGNVCLAVDHQEGSPCTGTPTSSDCVSPLTCLGAPGDYHCKVDATPHTGDPGEACNADKTCNPGATPFETGGLFSTCTCFLTPQADGAACSSPDHCISKYCKSGVCSAIDGGEHSPCDFFDKNSCAEGFVCRGSSGNETCVLDTAAVQKPPFDICKQAGAEGSATHNACIACVPDPTKPTTTWTAIGCIPNSTEGIITSLVKIGLSVAGGVVLLSILAASFIISTSQGDPNKTKQAQEIYTSALAGLFFIIFSMVLLRTIGINILQIPGF